MASLLLLGALCALPLTHAHMQMTNPSPFRDPHSNRASEPKDYDILKPLHADGSDFACKGYHLNTPWTTVATYEAGGKYKMHLQGSATHGGGSCQLSMSFDGGNEFKVIKSMEGGCPLQKDYEFTVPLELGRKLKGKTTGLFAWTWFNKIGNREMYMNCAAVDVVPKGRSKRDAHEPRTLDPRDTAISNAAAQSALSSYPPLFVANLARVNGCVTKEAQDVVFDTPGNTVDFADGTSRSARPSFAKGQCTGRGNKNAGSSSSSSSSPPPSPPGGGSSSPGNNGQWQPEKQSQSSSGSCANANDGQYHPECHGGQSNKKKAISDSSDSAPAPKQVAAKPVQHAQSVQDVKTGKEPSAKVEKELDAYLETLYSGADKSKRSECQNIKGTCHTPNRWVKRGECVWECSRKGRRSSTHIPVTVPDVLNSMGQPIQARQLDTLAAVPLTLTTTPPPLAVPPTLLPAPTQEQTSFDLFLTYLSRLQSTVIECIRGIAAISPKSIPANPASLLAAPRVPGITASTPARLIPNKHKRQLLVPFTNVKPSNLTSPPASLTAPRVPDILSALRSLIQSFRAAFGAPSPTTSASRNTTTTAAAMPTTAFLPLHLGHGPVVPDGVSLHWPALSFYPGTTTTKTTPAAAAASATSFPSSPSPSPPASTSSDPSVAALPTPTNAAQLLPWLTGPGPVIPPDTVLQWNDGEENPPGKVDNLENMPMVVDDLGPGAEEEVRQFFEDLKKGVEEGGDV